MAKTSSSLLDFSTTPDTFTSPSMFSSGGSASTWKNIAGIADIFSGAYTLMNNDYSDVSDTDIAQAETEQMEQETAARQQGLTQAKQVRQIMANQIATAAMHGISAASPSVQRVNESSYNAFLHDNDVEALNISMSRTVMEQKINEIRAKENEQEESSWFSGITSIGLGIASMLLL